MLPYIFCSKFTSSLCIQVFGAAENASCAYICNRFKIHMNDQCCIKNTYPYFRFCNGCDVIWLISKMLYNYSRPPEWGILYLRRSYTYMQWAVKSEEWGFMKDVHIAADNKEKSKNWASIMFPKYYFYFYENTWDWTHFLRVWHLVGLAGIYSKIFRRFTAFVNNVYVFLI